MKTTVAEHCVILSVISPPLSHQVCISRSQTGRALRIDDYAILEERASRDVWVCGAGAFIVLKALAFRRSW